MNVLILLSDAFSPINFPPCPSRTTFSKPSRSDCRIMFLNTWVDMTIVKWNFYNRYHFNPNSITLLFLWNLVTDNYLLADLHENKLPVAFVVMATFWTFEVSLLDPVFLAFLCIFQWEHLGPVHQEHIRKTSPFFHTIWLQKVSLNWKIDIMTWHNQSLRHQ